jgi:hypothetical protein
MKISQAIQNAFYTLAIMPFVTGCSEGIYVNLDEFTPLTTSQFLKVSPHDFTFYASGGESTPKTGQIQSVNPWAFSDVPDWLQVSPTSSMHNETFSLTADSNPVGASRNAIFYVSTDETSNGPRQAITATQSAASASVAFSDDYYQEVTCEAQTISYNISTNVTSVDASFSQSWGSAKYNGDGQTVSLTLQQNETDTSRSGYLIISSGKASNKLYITQHASGITLGEGKTLSFDADGGTQTVNISSDLAWTAKTSCTWLRFSPQSGNAGDTKIAITTLSSSISDKRIGQVYFYFGNTKKKYIDVTQAGRYINVSQTNVNLTAEAGASGKITIDSNTDWEIIEYPNWVSLSKAEGVSGTSSISIVAEKNNSVTARSGSILVKGKTVDISKAITVKQEGISFGEQQLGFDWHSGSIELNLDFPEAWSAAVSSGWISLSNYVGTGATSVTVSVTKNDSEDARTGTITFVSEGKTFDIPVIQGGQYIHLSTTGGEVSAMGGTLQLYIASTVATENDVVYGSDVTNWVHITKSNDHFDLAVDYNPSVNSREATIVISPTDEDASETNKQGVKFDIKQFGRKLATSTSTIEMFANGGTSDTFTVTADGEFSITKPEADTWYVLVPNYSTKSFYVIVTQNSTSTKRNSKISIVLNGLPDGENSKIIVILTQYPSGYLINLDDFNNETEW